MYGIEKISIMLIIFVILTRVIQDKEKYLMKLVYGITAIYICVMVAACAPASYKFDGKEMGLNEVSVINCRPSCYMESSHHLLRGAGDYYVNPTSNLKYIDKPNFVVTPGMQIVNVLYAESEIICSATLNAKPGNMKKIRFRVEAGHKYLVKATGSAYYGNLTPNQNNRKYCSEYEADQLNAMLFSPFNQDIQPYAVTSGVKIWDTTSNKTLIFETNSILMDSGIIEVNN